MMAESEKDFRRAALLRSKTAWLFSIYSLQ